MKPTTLARIFLVLIGAVIGAAAMLGQNSVSGGLHDPVSELAKRIEAGETRLEYASDGWGYLTSLLKQLDLNVDSQILVFSKTSFQLTKISPQTPRAIYFNDRLALGAVQDGKVFEMASLDPAQGLIFYTMDTEQATRPRFERRPTSMGARRCRSASRRC